MEESLVGTDLPSFNCYCCCCYYSRMVASNGFFGSCETIDDLTADLWSSHPRAAHPSLPRGDDMVVADSK